MTSIDLPPSKLKKKKKKLGRPIIFAGLGPSRIARSSMFKGTYGISNLFDITIHYIDFTHIFIKRVTPVPVGDSLPLQAALVLSLIQSAEGGFHLNGFVYLYAVCSNHKVEFALFKACGLLKVANKLIGGFFILKYTKSQIWVGFKYKTFVEINWVDLVINMCQASLDTNIKKKEKENVENSKKDALTLVGANCRNYFKQTR